MIKLTNVIFFSIPFVYFWCMPKYYLLSTEQTISELKSGLQGLTAAEVESRKKQYGLNILPQGKPISFFKILLHQFASPIIYVLLGAAVVALAMNELLDAGFIFLVLVINASIGTYQEWNAEQSAAGLQQLITIKAQVIRNGNTMLIDARELVPGDLVLLESGNKVPADMRLIDVKNLSIDEAFLTGESEPVTKHVDTLNGDLVTGDRLNMAFAGSTIISGRAAGIVTETGLQTEVGKIAENLIQAQTPKTPLVQRMEKFATQITYVVLGVSVLLFIVGYYKGFNSFDILFYIVALAVSAIPEGLPITITVALSVATHRMAKRGVIVKKLSAVEGLGSCTMIASDKTGTLTINSQTIKKVVLPYGKTTEVSGIGYNGDGEVEGDVTIKNLAARVAHAGILCNEANLIKNELGQWESHGDAVDIAFLAMAYKCGIMPHDYKKGLQEVKLFPYESEKKYAAAIHVVHGKKVLSVKGAPEALLVQTKYAAMYDEILPANHKQIEEQIATLTNSGYRAIAVWEAEVTTDDIAVEEANLTLLGIVGLFDPLREESAIAVNTCKKAGIEVAMVTGDHPNTALAIAKQLNIAEDKNDVVTGVELPAQNESQQNWWNAIKGKHVFARVSPLQKMQITSTLAKEGHFVAVTGDGVNDVPALKQAHIGVAMGSGTDLAKDTAEIIITNDDFSSIVNGVEEGRFAYDNIRKVTYLLVSTGAAEIFIFILALFFNYPLPFTAIQLLWLNLVTNGIQDKALAYEKGEKDTMQRKPRNPKEGIFNRLMIEQTLVSGLTMGLIVFGTWHVLAQMDFTIEHKRTLTLMLMVLLQNMHVFNCRSERISAFKVPLKNNRFLILGVLGAQTLHLLSTQIPFMQSFLSTDTISLNEWIYLLPLALILIVVMELYKWIRAKSL